MSAYSYNFIENISDPSPPSGSSHGTACAGEIVMARDNNVCGVGVAYDASVAGKGNYTLSIHSLLIYCYRSSFIGRGYNRYNCFICSQLFS